MGVTLQEARGLAMRGGEHGSDGSVPGILDVSRVLPRGTCMPLFFGLFPVDPSACPTPSQPVPALSQFSSAMSSFIGVGTGGATGAMAPSVFSQNYS